MKYPPVSGKKKDIYHNHCMQLNQYSRFIIQILHEFAANQRKEKPT